MVNPEDVGRRRRKRRKNKKAQARIIATRPLKRTLYEDAFGDVIPNGTHAKRQRTSQIYLYAFGGDDLPPIMGTVERYNIQENKWEQLEEAMPTAGFGSSIAVYNDHVWLVGGHDRYHHSYDNVHIYNPSCRSWIVGPPMSEKRSFLGFAELGGRLYAVAGQDGLAVLDSVEIYDDEHGWQDGVPMINGRSRFGMTAMNEKLFAVGGDDGDVPLNSVECFTLSTGQWTMVKSMENGRIECGIACVDQLLYVVGGDLNKSVAFYDGIVAPLSYWDVASHLCGRRARNNVSVVAFRKSLIVIGGHFAFTRSRKVDCFDTITGGWTALPSMRTGRCGACIALLRV